MCGYIILEDYIVEKYIYNEQNGLWYELQGDITFLVWNYPLKKKNDISAYGDIDICDIFGSIKRYFTRIC